MSTGYFGDATDKEGGATHNWDKCEGAYGFVVICANCGRVRNAEEHVTLNGIMLVVENEGGCLGKQFPKEHK